MSEVFFVNLADMPAPGDPEGRTYRQVNAARSHAIPVGALVELDSGVRLFVVMQTRDCDQEPLYSLAALPLGKESPYQGDRRWHHGYGEEGLTLVRLP